MRADLYRLDYPIFAVGYLDEEKLVLAAGGGGSTKSGIPNGLTALHFDGNTLSQVGFLTTGSKAAMSLAVHPREYAVILGVGERCWLVNVDFDETSAKKKEKEIMLGLSRAIRSDYSADSLPKGRTADEEELGYQVI